MDDIVRIIQGMIQNGGAQTWHMCIVNRSLYCISTEGSPLGQCTLVITVMELLSLLTGLLQHRLGFHQGGLICTMVFVTNFPLKILFKIKTYPEKVKAVNMVLNIQVYFK